ncbi:MAG: hypothetical protein NW207_04105 [Cytophagales bacterium]|nr:hypothetical protein [Cytophagales bacterium]
MYLLTKKPENKKTFGYEIGDELKVNIQSMKMSSSILRTCNVVGVGETHLLLLYTNDEGKNKYVVQNKMTLVK